MKRSFSSEIENHLALANCLMLLSQGGNKYEHAMNNNGSCNPSHATNNNGSSNPSRVFECKTCNRQFPSFQALGGHRASHKKPKLTDGDGGSMMENNQPQQPAKPKTHECSVCGLEFAIGQALGGHMRRHRAAAGLNENQNGTLSSASEEPLMTPVVKKPNSRRILCMDLNLTPLENDLELFKHGKAAPAIDCFF